MEVINKGLQRDSVIESIADNINKSTKEAEDKYIAIINQAEVEQGVFQNRMIRIRNNPGFPTQLEIERFTSNIIMSFS